MITSRQTSFWFAMWVGCFGLFNLSFVSAASLTSIDAGEVRHFEQTYEEWVQSLAQSIAPQNPNTVLVNIEYSNNPEDIQTYEELKAADHLPGLPDISDPNFTYPSESPIYSLVAKQRIKIIFEEALTVKQEKLLNEVLNSKLKLNQSRGDQFTIETVDNSLTGTKTSHSVAQTPQKPTNRNLMLAGFALILSLLSAAMVLVLKRKRNQAVVASRSTTTPVKANETSVSAHLKLNHPLLYAKARSILNSTQLLLKANPKHLVQVIRAENSDNLAIALVHAPESLAVLILNICTPAQRSNVRLLLSQQKTNPVTTEQSNFQQTVLAAKIHHVSKNNQNQALDLGKYIQQFEESKNAKLNLRQKMTQELQLIGERLQRQNKNLKSVKNNEASL